MRSTTVGFAPLMEHNFHAMTASSGENEIENLTAQRKAHPLLDQMHRKTEVQ